MHNITPVRGSKKRNHKRGRETVGTFYLQKQGYWYNDPQSFKLGVNLFVLLFSENQIREEGLLDLAAAFMKNVKIRELDLCIKGNPLTIYNYQILERGLKQNNNLIIAKIDRKIVIKKKEMNKNLKAHKFL